MISKKNFAKVSAAVLGAVALGTAANVVSANADTVYTVKSGDTLSSISFKFNKDNSLVNKIAQKNNISDINKIYVGEKLLIKSDGEIQPVSDQNSNNGSKTNSNNNSQAASTNLSSQEQAAKDWIAYHESRGQYNVTNGQYIGKYQLSASYLNGDYSPANQERVADQYVASRYGTWVKAQEQGMANGWY